MCGGTRSYVSNRYTIQESTGGDWVTYQKKAWNGHLRDFQQDGAVDRADQQLSR